MMRNVYVLIMAGGEGTRFAPLSTAERPKQFLNLVGEGTFLQQTRRRVADLVPADRIYVATNARYVDLVRTQLADIPEQNILLEPVKRNTAPCIVYATRLIRNRDPESVIIVLPSDHVILDPSTFKKTITDAVQVAQNFRKLVTLGITPKWPATEYGYIKADTTLPFVRVCHNLSFRAQPRNPLLIKAKSEACLPDRQGFLHSRWSVGMTKSNYDTVSIKEGDKFFS